MTICCPTCGSTVLTVLDRFRHIYRCNACDDVFSTREPEKTAPQVKDAPPMAPVQTSVKSAKEIYHDSIAGIVEIVCRFGRRETCGTGFFISTDGYLLTNAHVVISKNETGRMMLSDSIMYTDSGLNGNKLKPVYLDHANDLALLKAEGDRYHALVPATSPIDIGDVVYAIGNSRGHGLSIVNGIVGDMNRDFEGHPAFLFNALVTNGCSGGPILNDRGEVCGVTVGQVKDAPGMNYGIPIDTCRRFLYCGASGKHIILNQNWIMG